MGWFWCAIEIQKFYNLEVRGEIRLQVADCRPYGGGGEIGKGGSRPSPTVLNSLFVISCALWRWGCVKNVLDFPTGGVSFSHPAAALCGDTLDGRSGAAGFLSSQRPEVPFFLSGNSMPGEMWIMQKSVAEFYDCKVYMAEVESGCGGKLPRPCGGAVGELEREGQDPPLQYRLLNDKFKITNACGFALQSSSFFQIQISNL